LINGGKNLADELIVVELLPNIYKIYIYIIIITLIFVGVRSREEEPREQL